MALTRKMLKAMGIEEEKIDQIIEAHTETVDALKEQAEANNGAAEKLVKVQKELDELKEATAKNDGSDPWQVKYEALKEDFDAFKADVKAKADKAAKEAAFKALLKEIGVSEKRIESIAKVSDIDKIALDKDGNIKDVETLKKDLVKEWEEFIPTEGTKGANTSTPPNNTGGSTMTKEEIRKISDQTARQKAMAENPSLFGLQ